MSTMIFSRLCNYFTGKDPPSILPGLLVFKIWSSIDISAITLEISKIL